MNRASVLFTSAAFGGKSSGAEGAGALRDVEPYTEKNWKLTLHDAERDTDLKVGAVKTSSNKQYIEWSGAKTGTNEYLSAMVCDENNTPKSYGRLQRLDQTEETAGDIAIGDSFADKIGSNDTLYLFNEQYNGDYKSDVSSKLMEVSIPTTENAYDVETDLSNLTFEGKAYVKSNPQENYTATLTAAGNCVLPDEIEVKVNDEPLTAGERTYSYDSSKGKIIINSTVIKGDIKIKAAGELQKEEKPEAGIDYEEETLTNLIGGATYKIKDKDAQGNPGEFSIESNETTLDIAEEWFGKTLSIVRKGNGTTTDDSEAQELGIPARPDAPTDLGAKNATSAGNDGAITGTKSNMEYRLETSAEWKDCAEDSTGPLAPGRYEVRFKAVKDQDFASKAAPVEIKTASSPVYYRVDVIAPTFADTQYGYNRPEARPVTIKNTGDASVSITEVKLTGASGDAFELLRTGDPAERVTLPVGGKDESYSVQPVENLAAGEYEATIEVTYQTGTGTKTATAPVTFTVNEAPLPETYTLTVQLNGGSGKTTGGEYAEEEVIHIDAGEKAGFRFAGWTASKGGTFEDATKARTTFTMPAGDTTITANWEPVGGTGGGDTESGANPGDETASAGEAVASQKARKLTAPKKVTVSPSYNKVKISWKKVEGATGYQVYRSAKKNGKYKKVKTTKARTWTNKKLKTGKTWYYKVRAYKKEKGKSVYSKFSARKKAKVRPAAPALKVRARKGAITARWSPVAGATRYQLYRASKKNGKYYRWRETVRKGYVDRKKLHKGKTCYYKVRAYRVVKGKKIYGKFSEVKKVRAK